MKRGLKGVHTQTEISHEIFEAALYGNKEHQVSQSRFHYDKKNSRINLINQSKIALNTILTKVKVLDDNVRLEPLSKNGQYL